jgi:hypothetical protein
MRGIQWVYGVSALAAMAAGGISEQGCTASMSAATGEPDAGSGTGTGTGTGMGKPMKDAGSDDTGPYKSNFPFKPGDGTACTNAVGTFPVSTCDPSDETAQGCGNGMGPLNGCSYDMKCGDTSTCEPFTNNPPPATGVDNFRMRAINITAPHALVVLQGLVVTLAVNLPDSPDGGANCGENGQGLFNWLISVDRKNKKVMTGGSPPSTDPFCVGYCYLNGTVSGLNVAPVTMPATFTGGSFTTDVYKPTLNIPIFMAPTGVVILPIDGASLNDVSVSSDGNCIGGINVGANNVAENCTAASGGMSGVGSCSRWHAAGALAGYLTLAKAQTVEVSALTESLCATLTGLYMADSTGYKTCTTAGLNAGDYCAPTDAGPGHACTNGDSVWLSATFAASAVPLSTKKGVDVYQGKDLCNGGSL